MAEKELKKSDESTRKEEVKGKKFREQDIADRLAYVAKKGNLSEKELEVLRDWKSAKVVMGENHISFVPLSLGVVPRIIVNGQEKTVPMITEEPSVIAAASNAAKMAETYGGFRATAMGTTMLGQIQIINITRDRIERAIEELRKNEKVLLDSANKMTPHLVAAGGGALSINPKKIETRAGPQLIVDFDVECKDAMGANAVSKMAEGMAIEIERIIEVRAEAKILSNASLGRMVICEATFDKESLALRKEINGKLVEMSGEEMVERMVSESAWADVDTKRAPTHNKGIMNGMVGVAFAVGQDTRAIEAAAHSYAAVRGVYKPFSRFEKDQKGNLYARLEVPIPVGIIGGAINSNQILQICLKMVNCKSAKELAEVIGAVGLANNVAAVRMLEGEGITSGHMPLHKERVEKAELLRR
jgi:hydroxymethylglutaryl-CoA reductase